MILYYMEMLPNGCHLYSCKDFDRHKIWVSHPKAKLISKKQYEAIQKLSEEINKNLKNKTHDSIEK